MTREMKNSGIEWIGQIPADWEIGRVKNAFTRKNEKAQQDEPTILSLARSGVKVRDVSTGEGQIAESYYNYNPVEPFDLLLNPMDLYSGANCSISKVSGVISPAYINLKANEGYYPVFYDYYFKTQYWAMAFFAHGKGVSYDNRWTLSAETLMNYYIPVPTFTEQKKIADFLDSKVSEIDKMIAETKSSIENYKEYKQSVITEAVTKGLNKNVQMKDSGIEWIGQIPVHWGVNAIKSVATTCSGGTPNSSDTSLYDGDINWVCSYDLKEKPIFASGRKITQAGADTIAGYLQNIGSVLIAMYGGSGTIGNSGILECEARTNQAICSIKFNNQYIMDYYGFYYILAIRKYWMIYAVGTRKDPNISQDTVRKMPCVIPPLTEQELIIKHLDSKCIEIDKLIEEKEALVSNLEEYKKSLIYEYVTGKKTV